MILYELINQGRGEYGPLNFVNPYLLQMVEMINKDHSRASSSAIPAATLSRERGVMIIHRDELMSDLSVETLGKVLAYDAWNAGAGESFELPPVVSEIIDQANKALVRQKMIIVMRDEGRVFRFFVYYHKSTRGTLMQAADKASVQGRYMFKYDVNQKANLPVYLSQARRLYGKRFELEFTDESGWAFIHCPDTDPEKLLKEIATATDVNVMDYAYQKYRELRFSETPPTGQDII